LGPIRILLADDHTLFRKGPLTVSISLFPALFVAYGVLAEVALEQFDRYSYERLRGETAARGGYGWPGP